MMKQLSAWLLAVLILLSFAACKPREDPVSSESESQASDSEPESFSEPESEPEPEASENIISMDTENKEQALAEARQFLEAVKAADKTAISEYVNYKQLLGLIDNPDVNEQQLLSILVQMDYTVDKVRQEDSDGKVFAVEATITNLNMPSVINDYLVACRDLEYENGLSDEPMDQEEFDRECERIMDEIIEMNKENRLENYVHLKLYREDTTWEISPSLNLTDALLGGYYAAQGSGETA